MILTTATKKLARLRQRIRGIAGGSSAGKTYGINELLIDDAESDTQSTLTSIVSESYPHLSRGAMRDFLNILNENGRFEDKRWNKTEHTYTFPLRDKEGNIISNKGSKVEFFSADMPSKVRGPRRDRLFVNELNNIPKETWEQLLIRTKQYVWADWNPTNEFFFYTDILGQRQDVDFIKLTYKDNEALSQSIIDEIESHRSNKNWWNVYGLGELGELEGKIYKDWLVIDDIPHEARLERYGLDFGYSNDPAAIVAVYYYNGGYIVDEEMYQRGMHNNDLASFIKNRPQALVVADSAEPKSIDEMKEYGLNIIPSEKGQGSVNRGIDYVQTQKISVTKRSLNLLKEYRNYMWKTDREGNILKEADKGYNHTMDSLRYALESFKPQKEIKVPEYKPLNFTI